MNENNELTMPTESNLTGQKIPGDLVNKATSELPDNQRSAIRRLHAHYMENALSMEDTGKLIGVTAPVISQIFRGKYGAKLDNITEAIEKYFELADKRASGRKLAFIETSLTRRIWNVCDAALEFQRIAFIFGDQQIGKTESLIAYRNTHNHGSTIYVRMPTGGALTNLLKSMARALRISENMSLPVLRERVKAAFDDRMLLIVDEVHLAIRENSMRPVDSINYIREIFDETKCGVVLSATNVFRDAMNSGGIQRLLRETKRRRLCALQLPNQPSQQDLNTFAAAYGLPPASGAARQMEKAMIEDEALGMWLTLLRMGAKLAAKENRPMNWNHVLMAQAGLKEIEGHKF